MYDIDDGENISYVRNISKGRVEMKQPETKFHQMAEQQGIPLRTLGDVRDCLARDKARSKKGERIDLSMARLMLRHGRLTDEARAYVERYLAQ
jgi:hypothetical protein